MPLTCKPPITLGCWRSGNVSGRLRSRMLETAHRETDVSQLKVFTARRVRTMDAGRPTAEAIAIKDGRIVSVGTLDRMRPWLEREPYEIDDTFRDKVILPGFIDPHTHFRMPGRKHGPRRYGITSLTELDHGRPVP